MFEYYFTFRSATQAQHAAHLLQQGGTGATLLRTPKLISAGGCGYSVKIAGGEKADFAAALLRQNMQKFEHCYRISSDGKAEEVPV